MPIFNTSEQLATLVVDAMQEVRRPLVPAPGRSLSTSTLGPSKMQCYPFRRSAPLPNTGNHPVQAPALALLCHLQIDGHEWHRQVIFMDSLLQFMHHVHEVSVIHCIVMHDSLSCQPACMHPAGTNGTCTCDACSQRTWRRAKAIRSKFLLHECVTAC